MRVLRPYPGILGFYDGRNETARRYVDENWYDDGALSLGICSYALISGEDALVYDTHASIQHAQFIRSALDVEGVKRIKVVLSHWHQDHVAGNAVFEDCDIIAHSKTRDLLEANRAAFEAGLPPIAPLVLPTEVFESSRSIEIGDLQVELRHADIHSSDGTVILIPDRRLLLAGDTLEDPITYVVEPDRLDVHLRDLQRLRTWPVDKILPNHGAPDRIAAGGYDRRLIDATIHYLENLTSDRGARAPGTDDLESILGDFFASDALIHHPAYEPVHARNRHLVASRGT